MENTFKVLTYNGIFVDETQMSRGIYTTDIPRLHPNHTELKDLSDKYEGFSNSSDLASLAAACIENIKLCELKIVKVEIIE